MIDRLTRSSVLAEFRLHFGEATRLFRAPARTNIIGEHCDYNDGLVMPVNMALYTWLAIAPREDRRVRIRASNFDQLVELDLDGIQQDPDGGWQEYPKGVLSVLQDKGLGLRGADILINSEIPIGGGLSSSASLETAMALAMLTISRQNVDRRLLAWMCKEAENDFVGVSCGIMDQYIIALGSSGHAMMLDCRFMEFEHVPLPPEARLLVVNSGVQHRLDEGDYNNRQSECQRAVDLLSEKQGGLTALRDASLELLETNRHELGDVLYRRSRHVVTEIQRVRDALNSMKENEPARLGQLMNASHESLKNNFEVSCEELDTLVGIARDCDGVFGSRMVGAGFGGCTVSLVATGSVERVRNEISSRYAVHLGQEPWTHVVEASDPVTEL